MQRPDTPPLRPVGLLTTGPAGRRPLGRVYVGAMKTTRSIAVLLAAVLAAGGCGDDREDHGSAEAEHTAEQPGMTTPHVAAEEDGGHGEEIGGSHGEAARGPGAGDAHDLRLELNPSALQAGQTGEIGFKIRDAAGEPIFEFEESHTKQLHLIVVSEDLRHFRHVHPQATEHGTWRVALDLPAPGRYRVIADVRHEGRQLALTGSLEVDGDPVATGRPASDAELLTRDLRAGGPVDVEFRAPGRTQRYLGAAGHLVILSRDDLEYLHVHAQRRELSFATTFPDPGRYVMFLEYRRGGEVRLSRFEVTVD